MHKKMQDFGDPGRFWTAQKQVSCQEKQRDARDQQRMFEDKHGRVHVVAGRKLKQAKARRGAKGEDGPCIAGTTRAQEPALGRPEPAKSIRRPTSTARTSKQRAQKIQIQPARIWAD